MLVLPLLVPSTLVSPDLDAVHAAPERPVLELRDVARRFGGVRALDGISLSVRPGEVLTLLGPSGSGKSTTLRIVAGLDEIDSGDVRLDGRLVASRARGQIVSVPPEKRDVGMVFQSYALWPHMTVFGNVAFPLRLRKVSPALLRGRVEDILDLVGLQDLGGRGAGDLSGGEQQRVALARALVYEPRLLLLDEPLSNLDASLRERMRGELRSLQRRLGISMLLVTHDQSEAMVMSDRIAVMRSGRIEQVGSPCALYEQPATPFVRDFLGRVLTFDVRQHPDAPTRLQVRGESGVVFELPAGVQCPNDGPLLVACRPEDVLVQSVTGQEAGPNRLRARVESAAYLGERMEYVVRTSAGRSLCVYGSRRDRHPVGADVGLLVDTRAVTIWPGNR